jgi:GTP-binding protein
LARTAYQVDQLILEGPAQIAFAGRSNVGKSSLLNRLFNRKNLAKVSQTPGKTQSINYFMINEQFYFVDLPGYGYAKAPKKNREHWRKLVDAYFRRCSSLVGLVHLIDIRHGLTKLDRELIAWTGGLADKRLFALTKADKLSRGKQRQAVMQLADTTGAAAAAIVTFSAQTGSGRSELLRRLACLLPVT